MTIASNKAIFLDRDGTINVDKHYLYRIEDFEFLPGVIQGLKRLYEAGFLLVIITNQSGIARGLYTEADYNVLTAWMKMELKAEGIEVQDVLFCPHHPNATVDSYRIECECRKPGCLLFKQAIEKYQIACESSYALGDKLRDLSICEKTGMKGFWLYSESEGKYSDNIICIKGGILEAANRILNEI